jgi:hypothetical protein
VSNGATTTLADRHGALLDHQVFTLLMEGRQDGRSTPKTGRSRRVFSLVAGGGSARNRPFIRLTFGPRPVAGVDQIVMHPARLLKVGHIDEPFLEDGRIVLIIQEQNWGFRHNRQ